MKKIMNFPVCKYKSQNFAQSQQNFASSGDGETVTFRNSVKGVSVGNISEWWLKGCEAADGRLVI